MPEACRQHGDLAALGAMGILTEDELRHPELYTELYRCKNRAMERDLMQAQGAIHETLRARLQNQETMRKIASQTSMIVQALRRPDVQHRENLKGFLPRYQLLHEDAKDLARPVLERLNEEMPHVVQAMDSKDLQDLKDLQVSMQAQQGNGEPEEPQVMSQSTRRRRRNRQRVAGRDAKSEPSHA